MSDLTTTEADIESTDSPCCECNESTDGSLSVSDNLYCPNCIGNDNFCCYECENWTNLDDAIETVGNTLICPTCEKTDYYTCPSCDGIYHNDNSLDTVDGSVCISCFQSHYVTCSCCSEVILEENSNWHGASYCEDCFCNNFSFCDDCESYYSSDGICENCEDEISHVRDYTFESVLEYSSKPDYDYFRLPHESSTEPYLGVELEIELNGTPTRKALAVIAKYLRGRAIVKFDGSLQDGLEIVTCPMTLAYHKTIDYRGLLAELQKLGCRSHDGGRCGLHVHISKKDNNFLLRQLVSSDIGAKKTLSKLSRRKSFSYCQFTDNSEDRYRAVNCTAWTNEIRFWRGTLNYSSFMASLEISHALNSYVNGLNKMRANQLDKLSYKVRKFFDFKLGEYLQGKTAEPAPLFDLLFLDWLKNQREYGHAMAYIERKLKCVL